MRQALLALAAVAILAGCTSHKVTVSSDGSTVTTSGTGDNQTVTVQGNGGSFSEGKNAVDPAKLGLPVYPGAKAGEGTSMAGTSQEGTGAMMVLKTPDAFDKVYAWYKSQMPAGSQQMQSTNGDSSVAEFQIGKETDKEKKSVTITSGSDGTSIMLISSSKNN
jgi:hypothetical protein